LGRALGELARLVGSLPFATATAPFLGRTRLALAIEACRVRQGAQLAKGLAAAGRIEGLVSLAAYAFENPADPFPEIVEPGPRLDALGMGHPLLPRAQCVRNDLCLDGARPLLVVSGSNMSGKSTLLRTAGANAVLAQAGAPVRAARLRMSTLALGATLRVQDSLLGGRSRFFAEITRLRQILDLVKARRPVLFLLDELLSGTNSDDRRTGAEAVLRRLVAAGAIGLVTTHDLALTPIADMIEPAGANVHFSDHLEDDRLVFDYRLRPGVVRQRNALAMMRAVGIDV
jgi:DNA mismatch repair ATPase MutS